MVRMVDKFSDLIEENYRLKIQIADLKKKMGGSVCDVRFNFLEPDGSCITCRLGKRVEKLESDVFLWRKWFSDLMGQYNDLLNDYIKIKLKGIKIPVEITYVDLPPGEEA